MDNHEQNISFENTETGEACPHPSRRKSDEVLLKAQELCRALREGDEYQSFLRLQERLSKNEELFGRVMEFRRKTFQIQERVDNPAEASSAVEREAREIQRIPLVNAYLDAELALCRQVQQICQMLVSQLDIRVPEI